MFGSSPNILEEDGAIQAGITAWKRLRVGGILRTLRYTLASTLPATPVAGHTTPAPPKSSPDPSSIEQDFTTQGTKGDLRCPFAGGKFRRRPGSTTVSSGLQQRRPNALPTPPGLKGFLNQDPIAAEFHATDFASPPPSVTGSASKCPIRFLDQHSPEEVAKYFENHKHEIPRSHEICVKRYQSNEQSIRQLDAKYGNLVSMIQGLGMKHQPMLATKEEEEASVVVEQVSMEKVARWATSCSENIDGPQEAAHDGISETRTSNFDRPLKEIRVGESPSRPWGIQVPYTEGLALSNNSEAGTRTGHAPSIGRHQIYERQPSEVPLVSQTKSSRCPFGHGMAQPEPQAGSAEPPPQSYHAVAPHSSGKQDPVTRKSPENVKQATVSTHEPPKMVFTGPVFIGYTAEQASNLMQSYHHSAT